MAMIQEGLTEEEAQKQIWMVDIDGLLTIVRTFTYLLYQYTTYLPVQGTHCTGITGKTVKKKSPRENTGILEILPKHRKDTGNLVCSSCKFPDSKGKRYFDICSENSQIAFLSWICLPSQFGVCNSHKSRKLAQGKFAVRQRKNRENRKFENEI